MQVTVFSAKPYDRHFLDRGAAQGLSLRYTEAHLSLEPRGSPMARAVCAFVNDDLSAPVLARLKRSASGWWRCAAPASTMSISPPPANSD